MLSYSNYAQNYSGIIDWSLSITIGGVDEQREKEKHKLNLIFHNVAEFTKPNGTARKNDYIMQLYQNLTT